MENFDIHNSKRSLETMIKRINNSNLPKNTKRLLLEFSDYCFAEGLALPTIIKYLFCLKNIARWANKDLDKTDKKDMVRIVGKLEKSHYSYTVKFGTKISIKKFYKWLNGGEEYPDKVKWIRSAKKQKKKLPEELLSREDVEKMINAAEHIRDKALISVLYESGFRVGELLSLLIKSIEFDEYGAKIIVRDGKTGMRKIRLVSSAPYLATWIENHPLRDNPESPLWIGVGTRNKNKRICYENARALIHTIAKKANIKKRVYPHLFRHSTATKLANHLTEAQMNQYFGWVQGSKMASIYVHLSGRDLDGAILKLNGLEKENKEKEEETTVKKCHRCEKMNPSIGKFCLRCGVPLDLETVMKVEEKRNEMDNIMTLLLKDLLEDPEIQARIENKLRQIKVNYDAFTS